MKEKETAKVLWTLMQECIEDGTKTSLGCLLKSSIQKSNYVIGGYVPEPSYYNTLMNKSQLGAGEPASKYNEFIASDHVFGLQRKERYNNVPVQSGPHANPDLQVGKLLLLCQVRKTRSVMDEKYGFMRYHQY